MRVAFAGLLMFALAVPAAATSMDELYAAALHAFNPNLRTDAGRRLARTVIAESDAAGIDARLVVALVAVESRWHPAAVSPAGAVGLGQLMPRTAAALGVDPRDPVANVHGTVVHIARLLRRYAAYPRAERYPLSLAAYNAGAGAVARYGGVPPFAETRAYVRDVL
ncbi:MAG: lytic transglycosylase domain-containing protein, partial [Vulcanimicrobiaceae bacterium]